MRRWETFLVVGSFIGIIWLWVSFLQGASPPSTSPPPFPREDSSDPKLHALFHMERIHSVLTTADIAKMYVEQGGFTSAEDYLQSPYLPVLPQDLINPYTGKPIQAVPGVWNNQEEFLEYFKGAFLPSVPQDRLGNLAFTRFGKRFLVELYTEPYLSDGKIRISLYFYTVEKRNMAKMSSQTKGARKEYERMFEKNKGPGYFSQLKDTDKRLFSLCMYLGKFISLLAEPPGSLIAPPDHFLTLKELQEKFPLLIPDIKNPYTNQPIQEVSYYNPSPGNFTIIFLANEYDNTIVSSDPVCYDEENRFIVPGDFFIYDLLVGEAVGGYRLIIH